ncbi:NUDIX domain-containing protein [Alginatibacterium sediminis]|uniref:NUDIX domain-containing protein n=1 Tax=Alginatibacterium sediminis TaxID=2164068 RepID=A0A420E5P5_9ALTE|nr:NUDIX hydrolase [Alginatibacterium sediminis]RKF13114.1 NUDIX domain-containing protein [Alginatibacterium sediminis]
METKTLAKSEKTLYPRIGVGVIILNHEGKLLVGKRRGSHAPYWSIPGGHLDLGESFESAAIRELKEETGLDIQDPIVISVSNNQQTYEQEGYHSISVILHAKHNGAEPQLLEPEKCEQWRWVNMNALPQPHFEASDSAVRNYLAQRFYAVS